MAKRALEITREEYLSTYGGDFSKPLISVNYQHVLKAFNELYNSKQCLLLKSLRRFEILVVLAFYLEQLTSKTEKNLLDRI